MQSPSNDASATSTTAIGLRLDPATMVDPFPAYAALRQAGPVHRVTLPNGAHVWLVTRYHDVRAALGDACLSLNKQHATGDWSGFTLPPALDANLLNMDSPDHTRIRRLAAGSFTRRRVEAMRPRIQAESERLVDDLASAGKADLIADFAVPFATRVIGDLLGVPPGRREDFRSGAAALLDLETGEPTELQRAIGQLVTLLAELITAKRSNPQQDLLSALVSARDDGDRLSEDELTSLAFLLLLAGHESTVAFIGVGALTLLQNPGELAALGASPSRVVGARARAVVEELLRYTGPAQLAIRRFPREEVKIGGVAIPAGDTVMLALASANRDPDQFPNADTFASTRAEAGGHLAFGSGIHHCLGAALATVETEIALTTLARRLPNLALAKSIEQLTWRASFRARGLHALPVNF